MPTVKIHSNHGVTSAKLHNVQVGTTLLQLCDEYDTPLIFGCREGVCGACTIRVLNGSENLSEQRALEHDVLDVLGPTVDRRLACQCTVLGDVTFEVAD